MATSNRSDRLRYGVTLAEILVAIFVMSMLVGLLAPAAQRIRARGGRLACGNNLRQIGLALHHFEGEFQGLPASIAPLRFPIVLSRRQVAPPREMDTCWRVRLLAHLGHDSEWRAAREAYAKSPYSEISPEHQQLIRTRIATYLCPSESRESNAFVGVRTTAYYTSYYSINGRDNISTTGLMYDRSWHRLADATDGTSNTLLVGEKGVQGGSQDVWYFPRGQIGVDTTSPSGLRCVTDRNDFQPGDFDHPCADYRYWSWHPGGTNFLFADGSVHFLTSRSNQLLPALATRAGREPVSPIE